MGGWQRQRRALLSLLISYSVGGRSMARGGWRFGAGRPGYTIKAEQALRLDVRQLAARKLLNGHSFTWRWSNTYTGEETGCIGVSTSATSIRLTYSLNGGPVEQRVPILSTPCHYGGARPWLACPRCNRRVAVIYLRNGGFRCRHCNRVAYSSQSEDDIGRAWRKQAKLEARLGEHWQRPKGMHHATRERLLAGIAACEELRDVLLAEHFERLGWIERFGA